MQVETAFYNRLLTFRRKIFVDAEISDTPIPPLTIPLQKRGEKNEVESRYVFWVVSGAQSPGKCLFLTYQASSK